MAYDKDEIFPLILLEIEEGASLRSILKREDMPGRTVFFEWLNNSKEKANQYARACELRAENMFEDILSIVDENTNDIITLEDGRETVNNDVIQRARLRVDARKWMLGKMHPKKYGDKVESINTNLNIDAGKLTDEEIKKINDNIEKSY